MKKFFLKFSSYNPNLTKEQILEKADKHVTKSLLWTDYFAYILSFSGLIFSLIASTDTIKLYFSTTLQLYIVFSTFSIFGMLIAAALNYLRAPEVNGKKVDELKIYKQNLVGFFERYDLQRVCKTTLKNTTYLFVISFIIQGNIVVNKLLIALLFLVFILHTWLHFVKIKTFWSFTLTNILTFLIGFAPAFYFIKSSFGAEDDWFKLYSLFVFALSAIYFSYRHNKMWKKPI